MKTIFMTGTAGSGKSLLTSRLYQSYTKNGVFASVLNLDPGVENLPYSCDVDVRDYVDILTIMRRYDLGPNGALIMAADLIASKINEISEEINKVNPDYLIVDTPGQIELFAYRSSGKFVVENISSDEKMSIFLFDGSLITSPINFVSIALLSTSIKLRVNLPSINVVTKSDLIGDNLKDILHWSSNLKSLEDTIAKESDGETYSLITNILRGLNFGGFAQGLIPLSNSTGEGIPSLESALSRILDLGEEVED